MKGVVYFLLVLSSSIMTMVTAAPMYPHNQRNVMVILDNVLRDAKLIYTREGEYNMFALMPHVSYLVKADIGFPKRKVELEVTTEHAELHLYYEPWADSSTLHIPVDNPHGDKPVADIMFLRRGNFWNTNIAPGAQGSAQWGIGMMPGNVPDGWNGPFKWQNMSCAFGTAASPGWIMFNTSQAHPFSVESENQIYGSGTFALTPTGAISFPRSVLRLGNQSRWHLDVQFRPEYPFLELPPQVYREVLDAIGLSSFTSVYNDEFFAIPATALVNFLQLQLRGIDKPFFLDHAIEVATLQRVPQEKRFFMLRRGAHDQTHIVVGTNAFGVNVFMHREHWNDTNVFVSFASVNLIEAAIPLNEYMFSILLIVFSLHLILFRSAGAKPSPVPVNLIGSCVMALTCLAIFVINMWHFDILPRYLFFLGTTKHTASMFLSTSFVFNLVWSFVVLVDIGEWLFVPSSRGRPPFMSGVFISPILTFRALVYTQEYNGIVLTHRHAIQRLHDAAVSTLSTANLMIGFLCVLLQNVHAPQNIGMLFLISIVSTSVPAIALVRSFIAMASLFSKRNSLETLYIRLQVGIYSLWFLGCSTFIVTFITVPCFMTLK